MRPSKNAFLGYTYQQCIAFLLLAKMDAERKIEGIEIEATVDNNFDDVNIHIDNTSIYCQIKDIDNIKLEKLNIKDNSIIINGKPHKLSDNLNVLFFKHIDIECTTEILGFSAYKKSNVYIISLSRQDAYEKIESLYKHDNREQTLNRFFCSRLDNRELIIKKEDLPKIDIYSTQLLEKTINIGKRLLEFENILFIEGKPGIGKSHLVSSIAKQYNNNLVYRFWVSNQDKDYNSRLIYRNFLSNISKELFNDYVQRTEDEIIDSLCTQEKMVIIDGLDHVENYQQNELRYFVAFIDKLKDKSKVIVLSRPLKFEIFWQKQILGNWNKKETATILNELYHITDYEVCKKVFDLTGGYPILVRFVIEHYKAYKQLPLSEKLDSINDYYEAIISDVNIKSALSLFLTSRSFFMESEISLFLDEELSVIAKEFLNSYPYLFEKRLNRISLFHDSLNTFLRDSGIDHSKRGSHVQQIVYDSLIRGEKRYMSRFSLFSIDPSKKTDIVKRYSSIDYFENYTLKDCIDIESIKSFYTQIREYLSDLDANQLSINNYYDLSLIINILARDHVSTMNDFLYTLVRYLLFYGYKEDDITSSESLFSMLYYYKTNDATLLYNLRSNENFDTTHFHQELEFDVWKEDIYFEQHEKPFQQDWFLNKLLERDFSYDPLEHFPHVLANLYLQETEIKDLKGLQKSIRLYIDKNEILGNQLLKNELSNFKNLSTHSSKYFLEKAKDIILSLGKDIDINEYHINTLKEVILNNRHKGSFSVWPKVLNYIRLALCEKRKIDIQSIKTFFTMYHRRNDTTVLNIDDALKVFEDKKLISEEQSIDIIVYTQKMSEKGIRGLLTNYIELHSPSIIPTILNQYDIQELEIIWFNLTSKYINSFSSSLFEYATYHQLFNYHSTYKTIELREIENVLYSNKKQQLIDRINRYNYSIKMPKEHSLIKELENMQCQLTIDTEDNDSQYSESIDKNFNRGILTSDNLDFIKEKQLNPKDIAGYTNDYFSVFADIDIYKAFDKKQVTENAQLILRNAMIGKIGRINMYALLFHFPGNLPKFVDEYELEVDYNFLYDSFMKFLEISLLTPKKAIVENI